MTHASAELVHKQLKWRYATQSFDTTKKISAADWKVLEESLILTPSSFGLQPWRFVIVNNPEIRTQLRGAAWGQKQVTDASHFVVFCIKQKLGKAEIDHHVQHTAQTRGVPESELEKYRNGMIKVLTNPPFSDKIDHWAANQIYIALGSFMSVAALMGIDTCPMEGFSPPKFDDILGLTGSGYGAIVACAAGYRAADDKYANIPKVRFPHAHVLKHVE